MFTVKIKEITKKVYKDKVYDLCLDEDHLFYAKHKDGSIPLLLHNSLPDQDLDFANGSRERIREYLKQKYGEKAVLGVVTFGLYSAKSALQDVSRGLNLDTSHQSVLMSEVSKLPDIDDQKDLIEYFQQVRKKTSSGSLINWIDTSEQTIYWATKLIGQVKNYGTHAGGILITPGPVYNYIPVTRGSKEVVTAFREADGSSKDLSELGLLKLDVLGLKTLNVIWDSVKQIKQDLGVDISKDIEFINVEETGLFELVRDEDLLGVFQMDGGALPLVKSIKPDSFEDVVAISALNRPGPLETFGPVYSKWKQFFKEGTPELCEQDNPEVYPKLDFMREVTRETYYCLIFQEQMMQMVVLAADFNLGEADSFRRVIAWRETHPKYYTVEKYFKQLEEGMLRKGYSVEDVNYFVEYCRKFCGYSFNKSHAAGYSYTTMQCLYLKKYYPAYFYCNLLNIEDAEEYQNIISHTVNKGIEILPPSITKSQHGFKVEEGKIRIGFKAMKGLGETAYQELESFNLGQYTHLKDILSLPFKKVNKTSFQALIDCGTFDELGVSGEQVEQLRSLYKDPKIEKWFTRKRGALDFKNKPESLFQFPDNIVLGYLEEVKDMEDPHIKLIDRLGNHIKTTPLSEKEKAQRQIKYLGFSLSMAEDIYALEYLRIKLLEKPIYSNSLVTLEESGNEETVCLWLCVGKEEAKTKTGKTYYNLNIVDKDCKLKAKFFSNIEIELGQAYLSSIEKNMYGATVRSNIKSVDLTPWKKELRELVEKESLTVDN